MRELIPCLLISLLTTAGSENAHHPQRRNVVYWESFYSKIAWKLPLTTFQDDVGRLDAHGIPALWRDEWNSMKAATLISRTLSQASRVISSPLAVLGLYFGQ